MPTVELSAGTYDHHRLYSRRGAGFLAGRGAGRERGFHRFQRQPAKPVRQQRQSHHAFLRFPESECVQSAVRPAGQGDAARSYRQHVVCLEPVPVPAPEQPAPKPAVPVFQGRGRGLHGRSFAPKGTITIATLPYADSTTSVTSFVNPKSYQLLCPGMDGKYGVYAKNAWPQYPAGTNYDSTNGQDDMTNFTNGATVADDTQ